MSYQRLEKTCDRCGDKIFWDRSNKTMKETGSWIGDVDKRVHDQARCKEIQTQKKPETHPSGFNVEVKPQAKVFQLLNDDQRKSIEKKALEIIEVRTIIEALVRGTPNENNGAYIGQILNVIVQTSPELLQK